LKTNIKRIENRFLSFIKDERGFSDHTLKSYKIDISIFLNYCADIFSDKNIDLNLIRPKLIRNFIREQRDNYYIAAKKKKNISVKTVNRRLATIKSFFNFLYSTSEINDNPASHVKSIRDTKNHLPSYLSENIITELMKVPLKNKTIFKDKRYNEKKKKFITNKLEAMRDTAILETFYSTGIRLSELINLDICDMDQNKMLVKIMGKGGKERIVPIGENALISINNYLNKIGKSFDINSQEPLFVNKNGKRISNRSLQRRIKKYFDENEKENSSGNTAHSLRHLFATHMMDRGADILTVKELLGHSSLSSTQIYTRLNPETIKKVYKDSHPRGS